MIGAHLLAAELTAPPNAGEPERACEIRMHPQGDIQHGVAATHRKGPIPVDGFPGGLRVDAHNAQSSEKKWSDLGQSSSAGGRGCEQRKVYAEQVFEHGRVFRV